MVNEIICCTKVSVNLIEKIFDFLENNVDNILSKKKNIKLIGKKPSTVKILDVNFSKSRNIFAEKLRKCIQTKELK